MKKFVDDFVLEAKQLYGDGFIPLHRPIFEGNEVTYLRECIESNFVSSVGQRVEDFEISMAKYTGASFAIAVVNGTAALQIALQVVGVSENTEVLTQDLTFVASANAICHLNATPVFLDVDLDTMGLSPQSLAQFLEQHAELRDQECWNKITNKKIAACVPMHTFGNPCRLAELKSLCIKWKIPLVEDAAESLGSWYGNKHTGSIGDLGIFSFNGNKIITTGGGGLIITNNIKYAKLAKHLTTTAKLPHLYEFKHDMVGYNYRMPNLNAALGCAQMETLSEFVETKRKVHNFWKNFLNARGIKLVEELQDTYSNYWLNAIIFDEKSMRDEFLEMTNAQGVMTRPAWELMTNLNIHNDYRYVKNENALLLRDRIVNIPSSVPNLSQINL